MEQKNRQLKRGQTIFKTHRIISLLLVAIFLTTCFAGCKAKKQNDETNESESKKNNESNILDSSDESKKELSSSDESKKEPSSSDESPTETKQETKISDECDILICTGNEDGNCYELVANQIDGYPDSTFKFGVIKNNKWLVPMSDKCPFIDETGWWKGLDKDYQSNMPNENYFKYIGGPLFLYEEKHPSETNIIYNVETGVVFDNMSGRDYTEIQNYVEFIGFQFRYTDYGWENDLKYFNTQTGETKLLGGKGYFDFDNIFAPKTFGEVSEGLFYASGETHERENFMYIKYSGFFDLDGNMVLDLSEYFITDYHGYKYENGKYTITCTNNSEVEYDFTFDKNGKIISQEKTKSEN